MLYLVRGCEISLMVWLDSAFALARRLYVEAHTWRP